MIIAGVVIHPARLAAQTNQMLPKHYPGDSDDQEIAISL